ncbi:MAG: DNA cytosine methyltransferase [Christensenellales bacterium]
MVKKARRYFVRRFTPLECCRLQGFPDWWEDGVTEATARDTRCGVTAWRCRVCYM